MLRALATLVLIAAAPLTAKDSLGVFSDWGAFRDPETPRCYAIAVPEGRDERRELQAFASVGTWPTRNLRGQVQFRLSRTLAPRGAITLRVGRESFRLSGGGGDAWARDRAMDAAIVAAMRSANRMTVRATDTRGRRFANSYSLAGAATAMDAATLGCARRR